MSNDLRAQLLQAGLVNEKQAKKASKKPRKPARTPKSEATADALAERERQAQRARELNRQQQEVASQRARVAEIQKLLDDHGEPVPDRLAAERRGETLQAHHYTQGDRVRTAHVTGDQRDALCAGRKRITRHKGRHVLVTTAIAAKVLERDPDWPVSTIPETESPPSADDPYAEYQIPDDLMW